MKIGTVIKNRHNNNVYTVIAIEVIKDYSEDIVVYEVANEKFESHRFTKSYLHHYDIMNLEEE